MAAENIPEKIGRYEIVREVGRGGMGVVWLATDPFIDRNVAIKTTLVPPPRDVSESDKFYKVFFNEAKAAGKLAHPNIVYVHDANIEENLCYMVLEYVDGPTLKDYCKKEKLLPVKTVVNIMYQCAKALYYAHNRGVIHRDVKPGNIIISRDEGVAKITDFGIAALEGMSGSFGQLDAKITVHYASPEQLAKRVVTHQTDIFSLGLVMYELLTGRRAFEAETEVGIAYKIMNQPHMPLKAYRDDIPIELERILSRMLGKDLASRYRNGRELAQDLSAYFAHLKSLEREINTEEKHHALKRIEFFKEFSANELDEITQVTQWVDYPHGASIITEGDVHDHFYIIISGGVRIKKREKTLALLEAGDYFGEMAYLGKTTRTADVEAVGHTVLMRVDPTVIDNTSINTQLRFCKIFSRTLIQRLARTSELLSLSD